MEVIRSCLYTCDVVHHRTEPVEHRFSYRYFLFSIDLDEIERLASTLYLLSYRRFGMYAFFEEDHVLTPFSSLRESVEAYAQENGVTEPLIRIELITQLRCFGYIFNPVSFYYCYDSADRPLCAIAEVGNTFGEKKRYFFGPDKIGTTGFKSREVKNFYVSPFINLDDYFDFSLGIPGKRFTIRIDDYRSQEAENPFMRTVLGASRLPLTDKELLFQFIKFPFVTLKIITAIHWQALRLYLKGLPHRRKKENLHLQTGVYHAKR